MSTSLLHLEALRAPLALGLGYRSGPSAEGSWCVCNQGAPVFSDRIACMPKLTFAPEVIA